MLRGLQGIGLVLPLKYRYSGKLRVLSSSNHRDQWQPEEFQGSVLSLCFGSQLHRPDQPKTSIGLPGLMQRLHQLEEEKALYKNFKRTINLEFWIPFCIKMYTNDLYRKKRKK
jgi:hypothetical protein